MPKKTATRAAADRSVVAPDWEVTLLRVTLFTGDLISSSHVEEWWNKVVKAEPEETSRKPSMGTYTMSGPLGDASISLAVTPGRIDWLFQLAKMEDMFSRSLGKLSVQDKFVDLLTPLLQFPSISVNRLAYGVMLRAPVDNRIEGYRGLVALLPSVRLDPERSRDFIYQINRPRDSTSVPGLAINRISKWGVMIVQFTALGSPAALSTSFNLQLDLDISTDQDLKRDLSRDKALVPLFRELVSLGAEIAQNGDTE